MFFLKLQYVVYFLEVWMQISIYYLFTVKSHTVDLNRPSNMVPDSDSHVLVSLKGKCNFFVNNFSIGDKGRAPLCCSCLHGKSPFSPGFSVTTQMVCAA